MPQNIVVDDIETDIFIYPAEQQLSAVDQKGIHVAHHALGLLQLTLTLVLKVQLLLAAIGLYPMLGLDDKLINLFFIR